VLKDADALFRLVRDRDIARNTYIPSPYRHSDMTGFLERATEDMGAGKQLLLTVRSLLSDEPMGLVGLHFRYPQPFRAELGYWLGRRFWNQGIMTQAVKTVIAFAFETLKLHRLDVSHFEPNDASRRVIEKCWFRREGIEREAVRKQRRWLHIVKYGLLKQEYEQIVARRGGD
jgi:ribosomal-protein-alanine N-acetyltransferase